jgi:hypothetical protein
MFILPAMLMILALVGIIFGIASFLRMKWAWKANLVLQLLLVAFLARSVLSIFILASLSYFSYYSLNNVFAFGLTVAVLILLARPRTRAEFMSQSPPSKHS